MTLWTNSVLRNLHHPFSRPTAPGRRGRAGRFQPGMLSLEGRFLLAAPVNDNFVDAIALTGTSDSDTGTNIEATGETGEPNHAGASTNIDSNLNSVWWQWTAPSNVDGLTLTIDTSGSDYDTTLGVYTGSDVASLTEVASNDDGFGVVGPSLVSFTPTANTTYYIAVDGYDVTTGNIALNLELADSTPPTVQSVVRGNSSPAGNNALVTYIVTFSEDVTGVDASDFQVTAVKGKFRNTAVTNVTGSGNTYTVTINTGIGTGTLRLDVIADATILDAEGNALVDPFTTGETYAVKKNPK